MIHQLEQQILNILQSQPQGLTEFDLLKRLQAEGLSDFSAEMFNDELAMFKAHFLLFHILYRLRRILYEKNRVWLEIHVLNIRLLDAQNATETALIECDNLGNYYLNLDNLSDTSLQDVQQLLGDFWASYFALDKRDDALQVLGLTLNASEQEIENRYRQLAMRHHPDRGGEISEFHSLQQAIEILRRCSRTSTS